MMSSLAANEPLLWPADRLGWQMHVGKRPERDMFEPPRLMPANNDHSSLFKPRGGIWTSTQTADGSSAALDTIAAFPLNGWHPGRKVWRFKPKVRARVLVIDGADTLQAITDQYPYRRTFPCPDMTEIDFPAIVRDGYQGVHLTAAGASALESDGESPGLQSWHHESTVWLDFAAIGRVWEVRPERIERELEMTHRTQVFQVRYTPAYALRLDPHTFQEVLPTSSGAMTTQKLAVWASVQVLAWNVGIEGKAVPIEIGALAALGGRFLDSVAQAVHADCQRIVEPRRAAIERYAAWLDVEKRTLRPLRPDKRRSQERARSP